MERNLDQQARRSHHRIANRPARSQERPEVVAMVQLIRHSNEENKSALIGARKNACSQQMVDFLLFQKLSHLRLLPTTMQMLKASCRGDKVRSKDQYSTKVRWLSH